MLPRALLLAVLAVAAAASVGCATDPPLDVASDVDLSRFQGKWYEIARLPRTTETDCYGTTAFYTQASDGSLQLVHQCNVGSTNGPLNTISMVATVSNASVPAKLALSVAGFSGDYWILEVGPSYEYAVIGHPSRAYLWVLSRTPTLDPATTQAVLARAQSSQFDTSQLVFTPQPTSGERVASEGPLGPVPPALRTGCEMAPGPGGDSRPWAWGLGLALAVGARRSRRASA